MVLCVPFTGKVLALAQVWLLSRYCHHRYWFREERMKGATQVTGAGEGARLQPCCDTVPTPDHRHFLLCKLSEAQLEQHNEPAAKQGQALWTGVTVQLTLRETCSGHGTCSCRAIGCVQGGPAPSKRPSA